MWAIPSLLSLDANLKSRTHTISAGEHVQICHSTPTRSNSPLHFRFKVCGSAGGNSSYSWLFVNSLLETTPAQVHVLGCHTHNTSAYRSAHCCCCQVHRQQTRTLTLLTSYTIEHLCINCDISLVNYFCLQTSIINIWWRSCGLSF